MNTGPVSQSVSQDLRGKKGGWDVSYSIIIVNYNGGSKLLECFDSLNKYTSDFEAILIDNASTDNSLELIAQRFPQTVIVRNPENLGVASANNAGFRIANGRWIVMLNPDTKVTQNWLESLVKCASISDQIGIVTPKLVHMDGKTINSTGHIFNFRMGFARDRGSGELDHGQYDVTQEVASCCFACAAIKREVIDLIGFLDDKMFMYYEDVDYCIRARVAGWRILYCPISVVFHHGAGLTPARRLRRLLKHSTPYRLRIMLKCYNRNDVLKYGLLSVLKSMAAGAKKRDIDYFLSYARSPLWNLMNPPIAERKVVQRTRRVSDATLANFHRNPAF